MSIFANEGVAATFAVPFVERSMPRLYPLDAPPLHPHPCRTTKGLMVAQVFSETAVKKMLGEAARIFTMKKPLGPMHPNKTESHRRKSTRRSITVSLLRPSFAHRSPGSPHSGTPIRRLTFHGAAGAMAISWQTDRQNHIEVRGELSGFN